MALKSVSGSINVTDNNGNQHVINGADLNFELESRHNRSMGVEVEYVAEEDYGDWSLSIDVWEYPDGTYNHHNINIDNGTYTGDLSFEFETS